MGIYPFKLQNKNTQGLGISNFSLAFFFSFQVRKSESSIKEDIHIAPLTTISVSMYNEIVI